VIGVYVSVFDKSMVKQLLL